MFIKKSTIAVLSILLFSLAGCNNTDETVDRDEVTVKAIYQEYELTYSIEDKKVETNVYFRTSSHGAYVKLQGKDQIRLGQDSIGSRSSTKLSRTRFQPFLWSRTVPAYRAKSSMNIKSGAEIYWNWYDSVTDANYITKKVIHYPYPVETSVEDGDVVDTMTTGELELRFPEPIKKNTYVVVYFKNLRAHKPINIKYVAKGDGTKSVFTISHQWLRDASESLETAERGSETRRYGNLEVDIETRRDIPVLTSGEQPYGIYINLVENEHIENATKKGARTYTKIKYPKINILINF